MKTNDKYYKGGRDILNEYTQEYSTKVTNNISNGRLLNRWPDKSGGRKIS